MRAISVELSAGSDNDQTHSRCRKTCGLCGSARSRRDACHRAPELCSTNGILGDLLCQPSRSHPALLPWCRGCGFCEGEEEEAVPEEDGGEEVAEETAAEDCEDRLSYDECINEVCAD